MSKTLNGAASGAPPVMRRDERHRVTLTLNGTERSASCAPRAAST